MDNDKRINKYRSLQDNLLKIKGNNRCIRLRKLTKKHTFDLSILSELGTNVSDSLTEIAIEHKSVCILRDSDKSDEAIKIRSHLTEIYRNIHQSENETGSQFGYMGFPFLEGQVAKKYFIRGPLALFPVSLEYKRSSRPSGWYMVFSKNQIRLNKLLFVALEKVAGYSFENLDDTFEEFFTDFSSTEPDKNIVNIFKRLLEQYQIPLDKEQNYEDLVLEKLHEMPSSETDALDDIPLSIKNYKILGSFPQVNSGIYENYTELIELAKNGESDELIDTLLEVSSDIDIDNDTTEAEDVNLDHIPDSEINLILPSDASQDQIIIASQKNKMVLVNGPPGTGKSQVIANLISNSLMKGEKVLVVCDKKAALTVVYERLSEKNKLTGGNLGNHVVLLDKEKDDRRKMYDQLKSFLLNDSKYNSTYQQNLSRNSKQIDELIKKHSELANALNADCNGRTINSLYHEAEKNYVPVLSLNGLEFEFAFYELDDLLWKIEKIEKNYRKFENSSFSWSLRNNFSQLRTSDRNLIGEALQLISDNLDGCILLHNVSEQNELDALTEKFLKTQEDIERNQRQMQSSVQEIEQIFIKNNIVFDSTLASDYENNLNGGLALWQQFTSFEKITSIRQNSILEDSVKKQSDLIDALNHTEKNSGFLKKLVDSETRQKKKIADEFIAKHNIDKISALDKLQNGLALWSAVTSWNLKSFILESPIVLSSLLDQNNSTSCIVLQKSLIGKKSELQDDLTDIESKIIGLLKSNSIKIDLLDDDLSLKIKHGGTVISNLSKLSEYLSESGYNHLLQLKNNNTSLLSKIILQLREELNEFDSLVSFDINKSKMSKFEEIILKSCIKNASDKENWSAILKQEILYYFIEYAESHHTVLRGEPFADYEAESKRLRDLLEEKRNLVAATISLQIEKNNSMHASKKYQLLHELNKKNKVKPIRQLLEEFGSVIFDAIPCWLASPDMVSNIFPLQKNLFDLIIVDEASQLAEERAIPFLYRGNRIVVAGDVKQLKPHDLFESKDEDSIVDDDEIESFLVLVNKNSKGPRKTLLWHYRSKWQELIDFSNHAFYEKKLQVAPNVKKSPSESPIRWISVENGFWENTSNIMEAQKIVDTIHSILLEYKSQNKHPSIGVITFNVDQRDLIYNTIDNRKRENLEFADLYFDVEFPTNSSNDEIFIRNIENVQGDQRDIILFSIAYSTAPNSADSKIHTNFGLLSKSGGENRLNVAITRATERIYVVCSFEPDHLPVETAKNPGPKLLKQFLQYSKAVSDRNDKVKESILEDVSSGMNVSRSHVGGDSDSVFEDMVYDQLVARGYDVKKNIGFSRFRIDLAVVDKNDPTKYVLAIECDGAQFHQIESVRERDVSRQNLLESQGWNITRIWSRDYWRNSQKEINRIDNMIKELTTT